MMNKRSIAVAIFVKTPGHTPLKTRLAASEGKELAQEFYTRSTQCIISVVKDWQQQSGHSISPYWATCEDPERVQSHWPQFARINQGPGELGQKLHHVYSQLRKKYDTVLLLGADAPQITSAQLEEAVNNQALYTLGQAQDGGFYLFSGREDVPEKVWLEVAYSQASTAENLKKALAAEEQQHSLPALTDMDTIEDLPDLIEQLSQISRNHRQDSLLKWLRELHSRPTLLFLCTGNSCRSQMAEGWAKHYLSSQFRIFSAGIEKHGLNPYAVAAMADAGVDISIQKSQLLEELPVTTFHQVFTLCSHADKNCPIVKTASLKHIPFEDPPKLAESLEPADRLHPYKEVRDKIEAFVVNLADRKSISRQGKMLEHTPKLLE